MLAGHRVPTFPASLANRPFPTRYLTSAVRRAYPVLLHVEKAIHPRWRLSPEITKPAVGVVVILMAILLVTPLPMFQVLPASVIAMTALAYIEDDGLLLVIATACAAALSAVAAMSIWEVVLGVGWISRQV